MLGNSEQQSTNYAQFPERYLEKLGIQIAQPEIHDEEGRRTDSVTLFNLYGVTEDNKSLFTSNHAKVIPPQHKYIMKDATRNICFRKMTSDSYQHYLDLSINSTNRESLEDMRILESELSRLSMNARLRSQLGHNNQTWIDFPGLIMLVYTNKHWFFLRHVVVKMTERYGLSQLASLKCTTILRTDTIQLPHSQNLDNKEIMNFLASKSRCSGTTDEERLLSQIGDRLIKFFQNDQLVSKKTQPSKLLRYILDNGGYTKEIVDETLMTIHKTWTHDDIQQSLLAVFGKGKRAWSKFRRATATESSKCHTIVPRYLTIRGQVFKMPKLFKAYGTIISNASKKHDFESQYTAVEIPRVPEANTKRAALQKKNSRAYIKNEACAKKQ